jgi:hypothetical protein
MRFDHFACRRRSVRAIWPGCSTKEISMNALLNFQALDDLLFGVALFAPVSLLLSGSLALVAIA